MDATIVIVNWNVRDLLMKLLASLHTPYRGKGFDIIVVDNNSSDGSADAIQLQFPSVRLMANKKNIGFSRANNLGASHARRRYLIFLNPDTLASIDAVERLIAWMEAHPQVAAAGPMLRNADGSIQPSRRQFPSTLVLLLYALKLHRVFPSLPVIQRYLRRNFAANRDQSVEQVMGACMIIRRDAFEKVGGFDERFHIWFEEVDLCKRLRSAGGEVWFTPSSSITHYGGQSFEQVPTIKNQRQFIDSARKYAKKHLGIAPWVLLSVIAPVSIALGAVQQLLHLQRRYA